MTLHTLWPDSQTAVLDNQEDGGANGITTGTGIVFGTPGTINAIRFLATTATGGSYTVALWRYNVGSSTAGTLVVSKTVLAAAITPGVWNNVALDTPITPTQNVCYITTVWNSQGRYVATVGYFTGQSAGDTATVYAWSNGENVSALAPGWTTMPNGRFLLNAPAGLPDSGGGASYFVDVVFETDDGSTATLDLVGPAPVLSLSATSASEASLDVTGPAPTLSVNAQVEAVESSLEVTGPAAQLEINTFGSPIYEAIIAAHPYLGPLLVEALQCLCEQVSLIPNAPQHCCFRVGTEIIHDAGFSVDECCEGVAYVALGDVFPSSDSFPEQDIVRQANANCPPPAWGVYIKIGLIRCLPVGGIDPLPCNDWNQAALQNVYDTAALMRASCCIREFVVTDPKFTGWSVVIDRNVQGNPLGGCIERSFTMSVQFPNCEC